MSKLQAKCAGCSAVLSTSNPDMAGKTGKCPKCGGAVRFPKPIAEVDEDIEERDSSEDVKTKSKATLSKSKPRLDADKSRSSRDSDDEGSSKKSSRSGSKWGDDDDDRRTKKKRSKKKTPLGLMIGGGVALLVVVGVVLFFVLRGPTLRGEREIKGIIEAQTQANKETDAAKKLEAQLKVLALMMQFEQMQLTTGERDKLKAKYQTKFTELDMNSDHLWAASNSGKKGGPQPGVPKGEQKNDVDSLLAELKEMKGHPNFEEGRSLLKRIDDNVPINSPRRAEVFKALKQAAEDSKFDDYFSSACVRSAMRYAIKEDAMELVAMLKTFEFASSLTLKDNIADRLAELKNPACIESILPDLQHHNVHTRRRTAKILKGIGEPAEKAVQAYAHPGPKGQESFTKDGRFEAIDVLGEIGTRDTVMFLLALENEPGLSQQWIDNALKKLRDQKKLEPTPEEAKIQKDRADFKVAKAAMIKLRFKYNFSIIMKPGDPERHFFDLPVTISAATLKTIPEIPYPFELRLSAGNVTNAHVAALNGKKNLIGLYLLETNFNEAGLDSLKDLPDLRKLGLYQTPITDKGLTKLKDLNALVDLQLAFTQITDKGLAELTNFSKLTKLELRGNSMTKAGFASVTKIPALEDITLSTQGVDDSWIEMLGEMKCLKRFSLGGSKCTGVGFRKFTDFDKLEALEFITCEITDEGLEEIAKFKNLKELILADTDKITDASVRNLKKLTNLTRLNLQGGLSDASRQELRKALPKCIIQ